MDTKTHCKQFLIQVRGISYKKQFSGVFTNVKKSFNLIKTTSEILEERRSNYDFVLVGTMEWYNIDTENIYAELQDIWDRCVDQSSAYKYRSDIYSKYNCFMSEHVNPLSKLVTLKFLFNLYMQECYKLMERKAAQILEQEAEENGSR